MKRIRFDLDNCAWEIVLIKNVVRNGKMVAKNVFLKRSDGTFFYITLVKKWINKKEKKFYWAPMLFENDNGTKCIAHIVIVFRQYGKIWHIDVEPDTICITPTEMINIIRATRNSVDNPVQNATTKMKFVADAYSNSQRIGGYPMKIYYVIAEDSPQKRRKKESIPLKEYLDQTSDTIGNAGVLHAIRNMEKSIAHQILDQILI